MKLAGETEDLVCKHKNKLYIYIYILYESSVRAAQ